MSKKNHEQEENSSEQSDKKDPELFENEPVDLQPSRKGRIVSTLIVIVVAILVIWVFARNNEETQNQTTNEEATQEETATAEPLDAISEAANEATNPEDQLAALQGEFDTTWQATTDEITRATEMAIANFDDKKAVALEQLNDVATNLQATATKTIDQGLASAQGKVKSLSQTSLKSLTALQTKIDAKTKVGQLEIALVDANEQLIRSKEQVMAAINENTDKLTATIDQAVTKALEQDEAAKQQLAEQARTETEVTVTEEETIVTAEPAIETPAEEEKTVVETKPATVTGEGIEVTAERGDSITKLARKALASAMDSGQVSKDLSPEQRIYIEDYLQNRTGSHWVGVGDSQTFSTELMNEAVDHAQNLNADQLEHLKIYSSRVSF